MTPARLVVALGGLLLIVGSFLPWFVLELDGTSASGRPLDAAILVGLMGLAAATTPFLDIAPRFRIAIPGACFAVATLRAGADILAVSRIDAPMPGSFLLRLGPGLYVILAGAAVGALGLWWLGRSRPMEKQDPWG